jgi:hypothetical protein
MTGLTPPAPFTIGSWTFQPQKMPFGVSRPLFVRGLAVCAPAVQAAKQIDLRGLVLGQDKALSDVRAALGSEDAKGSVLAALGAAAEVFFDRATRDDFDAFEEAFAAHCLARRVGETKWSSMTDARELVWPELGYAAYTRWFVQCARAQFGPFSFGGSKGSAARLAPAEE